MRTVTLEEHFVTPGFLQATGAYGDAVPPAIRKNREQLLDLGEGRLTAMREGGVDMQVLSLATMGIEALGAAEQTVVLHEVHDTVAAAIQAHPNRFAAFATPCMKNPAAGARELERCVRELGFAGAMVNGTTDGKFLDDPRFLPVLEAAAGLGVPVYLHPAPPPPSVQEVYFSGLPDDAGRLLSIAGWGWHAENGLHILRLIVSGVLDRLPTLQIILGHMGEAVPYMLARSSGILGSALKGRERSVMETFLDQVHVTTSGLFTRPPFECCRAVLGLERMLYSVDYPFSANTRGKEFLESLPLSPEERAGFIGGHAEALLGLAPA